MISILLKPIQEQGASFYSTVLLFKQCYCDAQHLTQYIVDTEKQISGIGNVLEQQLKGLEVVTCGDLLEKLPLIKLLFSELTTENLTEVCMFLYP